MTPADSTEKTLAMLLRLLKLAARYPLCARADSSSAPKTSWPSVCRAGARRTLLAAIGHELVQRGYAVLFTPAYRLVHGGASIINLASMSSFFAVPMVPGYGAAKAGIVQMTKNLAVAWAANRVRVNAVAPGIIDTNMTAPMKGVDILERPQMERTAMHRWGTPAEVAPAFLFLASPAARFITGHTLAVDGGYIAS